MLYTIKIYFLFMVKAFGCFALLAKTKKILSCVFFFENRLLIVCLRHNP